MYIKFKHMKKVILLILLPFITSSGNHPFVEIPTQHNIEQPVVISPKPIDDLINALIYVESRGIDSAIGDKHLGEPSVGVLQLRPIMVREVNRILKIQGKIKRFKLKDRFDRQESIRMFMVWKSYHHPDDNIEKIARNWNGGPRGYRYDRTLPYWVKVQKQLNSN